jgi:uncharacterized protein YjbI with pentapeptide repeats
VRHCSPLYGAGRWWRTKDDVPPLAGADAPDRLDLTEANLGGCDFTDAVFDGCRLAGAELRAATFTRADLRGADLGQITPMDCHALKGAYISVDQPNTILAGLGLHIIK